MFAIVFPRWLLSLFPLHRGRTRYTITLDFQELKVRVQADLRNFQTGFRTGCKRKRQVVASLLFTTKEHILVAGDGPATFSNGKRYYGPQLPTWTQLGHLSQFVNKHVQNLRLRSNQSQETRTSKMKV